MMIGKTVNMTQQKSAQRHFRSMGSRLMFAPSPPRPEKGKDQGGEAAEDLRALYEQHDDAEREVEPGDKVLPEGKVGNGVHGGDGEDDDPEDGEHVAVEVCPLVLLSQDEPDRLEGDHGRQEDDLVDEGARLVLGLWHGGPLGELLMSQPHT